MTKSDGVRGERRPVPLALRSAAFGEQIETSGPHPEGEISVEPFIRRAARANVARGRLPGRAQGFPPEGIGSLICRRGVMTTSWTAPFIDATYRGPRTTSSLVDPERRRDAADVSALTPVAFVGRRCWRCHLRGE